VDLALGPKGEQGTRTPRKDVHVTRGKSEENRSTAKQVLEAMRARYGNSRLGRQELDAELLERTGSELWTEDVIELFRTEGMPCAPVTTVVAVDPTRSDSPTDEAGIVVASLAEDGHCYILEDASKRGSPHVWITAALDAARRYRVEKIVYEQNRLGKSAENLIKAADTKIKWEPVTASQGKETRAEPVSALYEQGKVHHVAHFPALEDEMTTWDPQENMPSPNRMDALVWAVTSLMLANKRPPLIVR
jgi:predicted phage terminase large subunit-like protein